MTLACICNIEYMLQGHSTEIERALNFFCQTLPIDCSS